MARKSKPKKSARTEASTAEVPVTEASQPTTKLNILISLMAQPCGASVPELCLATGWQAHSVRGAIAGAIKKVRGHTVESDRVDGARRYRIVGGF